MIISKPSKLSGIFFAIWPRRTIDGELVMLEWMHWEWDAGWGWGSGGFYRYRRWVPEARYQAGERAQCLRETSRV